MSADAGGVAPPRARGRTGSLTARVAWTTGLAAGLGAALAAAGSGALAFRLIETREDARLRDAAVTLAEELKPRPDDAAAGREADDEAREIAATGLRIGLFRDGRQLGGSAGLPAPAGLGCDTLVVAGDSLRRCVVSFPPRVIAVVGGRGPVTATRSLLLVAALAGIALGAAGGALASRRVAAWVVGPLARLRVAVAAVPADGSDPSALGPAEGCDEVDAVRQAIAGTLGRLDGALSNAQRFAADAAHELRTPLAAMRAELELLLEDAPGRGGGADEMARLHARVIALGTLVDRLLVLAAPGGGVVGQGQAVSLAELVGEAVAVLPATARARVVVRADGEGMVRGDPALLRTMLDNALDNALKFAPSGEITVALRESQGDGGVTVEVRDRGPGIPPAERARAFAPFYRTPAARASTAAGHGIGLALVAHIAASHGGRAVFRDVEPGACLALVLPAWRA